MIHRKRSAKPLTTGAICRSISRAFWRWEKQGRPYGSQPHWFDIFSRRLSSAMAAAGCPVEIRGPYGLCCTVTIKRAGKRFKKSVQVEMENFRGWSLGYRDYSINTGEFKPGTIGALNGMNHPYHRLSPKTDINWFIERLK